MMNRARQIMQSIRSSGDPQAIVNNMLSNNPQINQIIKQYGGDPKTAFYKYAEANGVNPDEILNMMK